MIVSEVSFQEQSSGASSVVGQFVSAEGPPSAHMHTHTHPHLSPAVLCVCVCVCGSLRQQEPSEWDQLLPRHSPGLTRRHAAVWWVSASLSSVTTSNPLPPCSAAQTHQAGDHAQAQPALHQLCLHVLPHGSPAQPDARSQVVHHGHGLPVPGLPERGNTTYPHSSGRLNISSGYFFS